MTLASAPRMAVPVIFAAIRTPFGKRGARIRDTRPDSLLAYALKGVIARAGADPARVEDVVCGTVTQAGEQGANIGRLGVLLAGFPVAVPAVTLNRMCGSSQQAVTSPPRRSARATRVTPSAAAWRT